jgi:hypothetical protein
MMQDKQGQALGRMARSWSRRQVVSRQWLIDATTERPSNAHLAPGSATRNFGYGYQV